MKCVCTHVMNSGSNSTRQWHNDTRARHYLWHIYTSCSETFTLYCAHPARSDAHVSRTDRGITWWITVWWNVTDSSTHMHILTTGNKSAQIPNFQEVCRFFSAQRIDSALHKKRTWVVLPLSCHPDSWEEEQERFLRALRNHSPLLIHSTFGCI